MLLLMLFLLIFFLVMLFSFEDATLKLIYDKLYLRKFCQNIEKLLKYIYLEKYKTNYYI